MHTPSPNAQTAIRQLHSADLPDARNRTVKTCRAPPKRVRAGA